MKDDKCDDDILTGSGKDFFKDHKDYSQWERNALRKLYGEGGLEGFDAVNYIVQNDVHIVFKQETQPAAWHPLHKDIYLNSDEYSEESDPTDPFMLSSIAHESIHLQQGMVKAITLPGETEAWQVGFTVFKTMTGQYPGDIDAATKIMTLNPQNMGSKDMENARQWMLDFDPGYRSHLLLPWSREDTIGVFVTTTLPAIPVLFSDNK